MNETNQPIDEPELKNLYDCVLLFAAH